MCLFSFQGFSLVIVYGIAYMGWGCLEYRSALFTFGWVTVLSVEKGAVPPGHTPHTHLCGQHVCSRKHVLICYKIPAQDRILLQQWMGSLSLSKSL